MSLLALLTAPLLREAGQVVEMLCGMLSAGDEAWESGGSGREWRGERSV